MAVPPLFQNVHAEEISSGTPLDERFGKMPLGSQTAVVGAPGSGKTTLLRAIARNVGQTERVWFFAPGAPTSGPPPGHADILWIRPTSIADVIGRLDPMNRTPRLLIIDDAGTLPTGVSQKITGALWLKLAKDLRVRGITFVSAWNCRSAAIGGSLSKGVGFMADLTVELKVVATTSGGPTTQGVVAGVRPIKQRHGSNFDEDLRLWIRPGHPSLVTKT